MDSFSYFISRSLFLQMRSFTSWLHTISSLQFFFSFKSGVLFNIFFLVVIRVKTPNYHSRGDHCCCFIAKRPHRDNLAIGFKWSSLAKRLGQVSRPAPFWSRMVCAIAIYKLKLQASFVFCPFSGSQLKAMECIE